MKSSKKHLAVVILAFSVFMSIASKAQEDWNKVYRGFNISEFSSENDIMDLDRMNVNLIRLSFDLDPLLYKSAPYKINPYAFQRLDTIIQWCKKYKIAVIIDPHTTPGTQSNFTTFTTDSFWTDAKWRDYLFQMWMIISEKYKNEKAVLGYDLLNEPSFIRGKAKDDPTNWNELIKILVQRIRANSDTHSIIIEIPSGEIEKGKWLNRIQGIVTIKLPEDSKLVISPHIYEPQDFTQQGVNKPDKGYQYPGTINNKYWDKDSLEKMISPILEFQKKYKVPVFIGEFSASRFTKEYGVKYVRDLIQLFEKYHWSWCYHHYRSRPPKSTGINAWDAEASLTDLSSNLPDQSSEKLKILVECFKKNFRK